MNYELFKLGPRFNFELFAQFQMVGRGCQLSNPQGLKNCSSDPCLENAPCVNATLGYYCQCPVVPTSAEEIVYSGQNCDESYRGNAGCNIIYYDSEGNITSPGYPNGYPNRQDCYSHLKIADATQITLILEEFNLEPPLRDALIFGKGPAIYEVDPMQPDIYELDGDRTSLPLGERTYVFNDTNQIFFYFYSDKNVVYPGYRISYTADVDSCMSGPCFNDATCMDEYYDYSCICAPGYEGRNCEDDIDECGSMPCVNGGNCMDLVNGHYCDCLLGFSGAYCQINDDDCSSDTCENDGTCLDGIGGYTCICAPGWDDPNCQTNIDECDSQPCQNEGTCADETNMYTCFCAVGYTDVHCERDINECLSNPCENEGTCTDQSAMYTCTCAAGYEGDNCEMNINECMSRPCQNGGLCVDGINLYFCVCTGMTVFGFPGTGFDGTHCQNNIDECASDPCFNGGTCTDGINEYSCQCAPGWTDIMCEGV
ncbi:fibropellin-1 [Strongylocentrotus purpuratus]|uniref:Uncharacterized protein n=1 Tax=Strongylocentrotus purpuratus TaxID=7668 RepID=A0A7M7NT07_STRPU|nr:fibropellin-1 [Strongylocentrotus purpuratus]